MIRNFRAVEWALTTRPGTASRLGVLSSIASRVDDSYLLNGTNARDIAEHMGIKAINQIDADLVALERAGLIAITMLDRADLRIYLRAPDAPWSWPGVEEPWLTEPRTWSDALLHATGHEIRRGS